MDDLGWRNYQAAFPLCCAHGVHFEEMRGSGYGTHSSSDGTALAQGSGNGELHSVGSGSVGGCGGVTGLELHGTGIGDFCGSGFGSGQEAGLLDEY
jgi:hypothetical protein